MRSTGLYVLAALLTLATVPIYRYIYHRAARPDSSVEVLRKTPPAAPVHSRMLYMTPDESSALEALNKHRAKCVGSVVYRTYDHVIEPWPGHVRCLAPEGVLDGPQVSVGATGHP